MADELFDEEEIFTLTDEDGNESQFSLLGSCELDGHTYLALAPIDEEEKGKEEEYVILKIEYDANGEEILATIDDDEEFDRVADIFEDELYSEIDHDADDDDNGDNAEDDDSDEDGKGKDE